MHGLTGLGINCPTPGTIELTLEGKLKELGQDMEIVDKDGKWINGHKPTWTTGDREADLRGVKEGAENAPTPEEKEYMDEIDYRGALGKVLWIVVQGRPGASKITGDLCRHLAEPLIGHFKALMHLIQYLYTTRTYKIRYVRGQQRILTGYVDGSWMGDPGAKSVAGWVIMMNGGAISWGSKRIGLQCFTSTEVELAATRPFLGDLAGIRTNLVVLDPELAVISSLMCEDNEGVEHIARGGGKANRTKHLDNRELYIRAEMSCVPPCLVLEHCPTEHMLADLLTKVATKLVQKYLENAMMNYDRAGAAKDRQEKLPTDERGQIRRYELPWQADLDAELGI
jgi:hypothetical protein